MSRTIMVIVLWTVAITIQYVSCQEDIDPNREVKDSIMNSFLESDLD